MKRSKWLGGLAALLLIGSTAVLRAEDMGKGDDPAMEMHGAKGMEDGMCSTRDGKPMDRMKEKLGLSESQESKLKDLFKKQGEEMKPLRDQMKIDIDTLQQKVDTKASDDTVKKLLDDLSADREKMQDGRKKMEDQLKDILTPIQQAKMVLSMGKRGRNMRMGNWKQGNKKWDGHKGGHKSTQEKGTSKKADSGSTSDDKTDGGNGN